MTKRGPGRPPTSRAFEHACRVYAAMRGASIPAVEIGDSTVPADASAVYVGNLLPLTRSLGYPSTAQYARIVGDLTDMGCVAQLRKGHGGGPGRPAMLGAWALFGPPTPERWTAAGKRPFSVEVEQRHRANHTRAVRGWLERVARDDGPEIVGIAVADLQRQGVAVPLLRDLIGWMVGQSEVAHRREHAASGVCFGYAGGPHVCGVDGLDPLADDAAGGQQRRLEHAARVLDDWTAKGGEQE